ncbi:MAG: sigma-54 dependent transcriptional regulator [Candidatus Manganitrophaceae bacterium]
MIKKKILIVEDEISVQESLRSALKEAYSLSTASDGEEGWSRFLEIAPDLILLDLSMPRLNGMAVLKRIREVDDKIPVIMLTASETIQTAVEAIKSGADEYLTKPFDLEVLRRVLSRALSHRDLEKEVSLLRETISKRCGEEGIVGQSRAMEEVLEKVRQIAETRTTVLLLGESGTGKELIAKALHYKSPRKKYPFVAINCAAIPENLLESELFGHERGAFTDAQSRRIGRFEQAHRGTLFLDEIAELSLPCQAKILRALEERKFMRVGGGELIETDVRVIAATNKNLQEEIRKGRFREDLYYRINVVPIFLPPLRSRREDIPLLVKYFLDKASEGKREGPISMTPPAMEVLSRHDWPGNVREMENLIEQTVALSSSNRIDVGDLPETVRRRSSSFPRNGVVSPGEMTLVEAVEHLERGMISQALRECDEIQTRAARLLGITRRQLKYKMDALGLSKDH